MTGKFYSGPTFKHQKRIGISYSAVTPVVVRKASDDKSTDSGLEKAIVIRKEFPDTWLWNSFEEGYGIKLFFNDISIRHIQCTLNCSFLVSCYCYSPNSSS